MSKEWEKRAGESRQAFAAFQVYLGLGAGRSLGVVGQELGKSKAICERWSSRWGWVERVEAYDGHMDQVRQVAREEAAQAEEQKWAERQAQQREEEWDLRQEFVKLLRDMLRKPPARYSNRDMALYAEIVSKLGRLATELETERRVTNVDFSQLSDEELDAYITARLGAGAGRARKTAAERPVLALVR